MENIWEHLPVNLLPRLWEATYGLHYPRIQRQDIFITKSDDDLIVFQTIRAGMVTLLQHIRVETDLRRQRWEGGMQAVLRQGQGYL
eukprot:7669458-Alexandrium_andersonii.AAC.1